MPIRMVLFDLVGTILRPAVPVEETYAAAAARHGLPIDPAVVAENFQRALANHGHRLRAGVPSDGDDRVYWREIVGESLAPALARCPGKAGEIAEELYLRYGSGDAWRLYPEVRGVLDALQCAKRPLGILSNWDRRARRVLADLGISDFFSALFLSAEMGVAKPDPRVYRLAAERLGLPPTALLLVGDDPESDGTAPRACGYSTWLVRRPEDDLESLLPWLAGGV